MTLQWQRDEFTVTPPARQIASEKFINFEASYSFAPCRAACRYASNGRRQILFYLSQLTDSNEPDERMNV